MDVGNGMPFFAAWCKPALVVLVHHVHREQWRVVMPPLQARPDRLVESSPGWPRGSTARARYVAVSRRPAGSWSASASPPPRSPWSTAATLPDPAAAVPHPYPSVCVLGRLVPRASGSSSPWRPPPASPHLPNMKMLVVGQGYWESRLRETVDRLGLGDAVELLGWVDEETKQRVLASSGPGHAVGQGGLGPGHCRAAASGTPTVAFGPAGISASRWCTAAPACPPTTRRVHPAGLGPAQPAPAGAARRGGPGPCNPLHLARGGSRVRGGGGRGDLPAPVPQGTPVPPGRSPPMESAFGRRPGDFDRQSRSTSATRRRPGAWSRPRRRSGWRPGPARH